MKSTEKFLRNVLAEATAAHDRIEDHLSLGFDTTQEGDSEKVSSALRALGDAITILADHDKQAKARRRRVVWIHVAQSLFVALVGREVFRYDSDRGSIWTHHKGRRIDVGKALDTEGASRKVRAWRKKQ